MKPAALSVNVAGIPDALKPERRWSVSQYQCDDKSRSIKKPLGRSNDPATWQTFAQALALYQRGGWDGLLFALGDGWGGGDLDHCCQGGMSIFPGATAIIERFGCYCEMSPSGTGFKLFFRSARVGFQVDFATMAFTAWRAPRFFAVTGHGSGDPTVDGTRALDFTLPERQPEPSGPREGYPDADITSDDDLLLLMVGNDTNGDDVLALWRGDMSAYGNDHSRADMALLRHLAFWTSYDSDRVERLFRQSGLMRPHWDKSASYRRVSLGKALR
jgi:putative DNA primase/helicase